MSAAQAKPRPIGLARFPVVLRDGEWWLVSGAGEILATDPVFTGALDRFAAAIAAADQAVAELRARTDTDSESGPGGQR